MIVVKICGLTRPEDARAAVVAGADWIGINFWPQSRRFVGDVQLARDIAAAARAERPAVQVVGVFVNQLADELERIAGDVALDLVQLHGDETAQDCARFGARAVKAIALAGADDVDRAAAFPVATLLVDTPAPGYGGSGRAFDWSLARAVVDTGKRVLLAGGLDPDNVALAIAQVRPFGVDVASGVETAPGIKDAHAMARFVRAAKGAGRD